MKDLHKLTIKGNGGPSPIMKNGLSVYLDDKEIICSELSLSLEDNETNMLELRIIPGEVFVDAEVLTELQAVVEKQEPAT